MIFKSKKTRFVILFSYFMATSLVVFIKILSSSLTLQLLFYLISDNFVHGKQTHFGRESQEFASHSKPSGDGEDYPVHHK